MQKIIPHLWFDKDAKEAAQFYASIFPNSSVDFVSVLRNTPSGDTDVVAFTLCGYSFMSISAGPYFKPNPSISFMVNFDPPQDAEATMHIDAVWEKLAEGGKVLMPIAEYPFSKRYGWVEDKYGFSWQLILTNPDGEKRPMIMPSMLFVGDVCGKAEEAVQFYASVFKDAKTGMVARYPAGMDPDKEGTVMFSDFLLEKQWFVAMDSARMHDFGFNEAISLMVNCKDQEEIDYYWEKLSAVPDAEQCGWIKDKYGVSWQIVPEGLEEMLRDSDAAKVDRVMAEVLKMKKLNLAEIQAAADVK